MSVKRGCGIPAGFAGSNVKLSCNRVLYLYVVVSLPREGSFPFAWPSLKPDITNLLARIYIDCILKFTSVCVVLLNKCCSCKPLCPCQFTS